MIYHRENWPRGLVKYPFLLFVSPAGLFSGGSTALISVGKILSCYLLNVMFILLGIEVDVEVPDYPSPSPPAAGNDVVAYNCGVGLLYPRRE